MYLLDTNVVSELRRRDRCDENVASWYDSISDDELFLSVLTLGEIRKGIALVQDRDPLQAEALDQWLTHVKQSYEGRILSVNMDISEVWGQMHYIRNAPVVDGLLAATAMVHNLTLVTRNIQHVQGLGASLLNPFAPAAGGQ